MLAAQMVVARRLPIIWGHLFAPTPDSGREVSLMVTEKLAAAGEGAALMPGAAVLAGCAVLLALSRGAPPVAAAASGLDVASRALLAPGRRRVRANAQRLAGKH